MRHIGFVISGKENEGRRALLPRDLVRIRHCDHLIFESGYARNLGIDDEEYIKYGCQVAPREHVYQCAVVCNPKAPERDEWRFFGEGQTLFGWLHAVQGFDTTDALVSRRMTGIAWENMFEGGRHSFWRNNEIAGRAAILHALPFLGRLPDDLYVGLIGLGNCGRGAYGMMTQLGARIATYDRRTERRLREELQSYDVVVNAVLWDVTRTDHILYVEDLRRMRPGAMIIDISCDPHLGIESSRPTTIGDPVYVRDGILHYAVDHTPALFPISASEAISAVVARFVDYLVEDVEHESLRDATVIERGIIRDQRIVNFQKRRNEQRNADSECGAARDA